MARITKGTTSRYYHAKRGDKLVFDTRLPKPTSARGHRRNEGKKPSFPSWAFKPRLMRNNQGKMVEVTNHLIIVNA